MIGPAGLGQDEWGCWPPSCQERAAFVCLWVGKGAGRGYRCHWGPASSLVSALSSHRCSPWPAWQAQVGSAWPSPARYLPGSACPVQRAQPRAPASPLPGPLRTRSVGSTGTRGECPAPGIQRVKQGRPWEKQQKWEEVLPAPESSQDSVFSWRFACKDGSERQQGSMHAFGSCGLDAWDIWEFTWSIIFYRIKLLVFN